MAEGADRCRQEDRGFPHLNPCEGFFSPNVALWGFLLNALPCSAEMLHGKVVGVADGDTLTLLINSHRYACFPKRIARRVGLRLPLILDLKPPFDDITLPFGIMSVKWCFESGREIDPYHANLRT